MDGSGRSRCAAASRRRWRRLLREAWRGRWRRSRCCSLRLRMQWEQLRAAAAQHGIRILGDVAIFVNMDSADVWVHPEFFELDEDLQPMRVAGVPPDYFSPTGQRWGNPLYRWDVLEESGIRLVDRAHSARACQLYDIVRLDHFRGFEALLGDSGGRGDGDERRVGEGAGAGAVYGAGGGAGTAAAGGRGPGADYGGSGRAAAWSCGLPGMKVIQFGFSDKGAHMHLPHQFTPAHGGLYGHARQRHYAGLVEARAMRADAKCGGGYVGPVVTGNGSRCGR